MCHLAVWLIDHVPPCCVAHLVEHPVEDISEVLRDRYILWVLDGVVQDRLEELVEVGSGERDASKEKSVETGSKGVNVGGPASVPCVGFHHLWREEGRCPVASVEVFVLGGNELAAAKVRELHRA